jgi:AcrR family transcriptional regulator
LTPEIGRVKKKLTASTYAEKRMATPPTSDGRETAKSYHHGALREALLDAAERLLERDGIAGLTLRAAAREAGASHAAPKNHFGDLAGLLSELAAVGFERFSDHLGAAAAAQSTAEAKLNAIGRAYVEFALANPGLFQLMFRGERLDTTRPALRKAMDASYALLTAGVTAAHPAARGTDPIATAARVARAWTMVHGYAMLLLDGRLDPLLSEHAPPIEASALLDAMLNID